jgi:hypothetical protein
LTSRSDEAQSSSVVSIDAPDTTISESSHGSASIQSSAVSASAWASMFAWHAPIFYKVSGRYTRSSHRGGIADLNRSEPTQTRNDESAGMRRSTRLRKGAPWLKRALVQCAWAAATKRPATCRLSSNVCVVVADPKRPSVPLPPRARLSRGSSQSSLRQIAKLGVHSHHPIRPGSASSFC